jgi:molecular chaperone HscB
MHIDGGGAVPPFLLAARVSDKEVELIDFSHDYFALFGLPQRYRVDPALLEQAYRRLQTEVHPDRFAAGSDQQQRLALQSSAHVNEAYRALRDPVERARYLLRLRGVDALDETDTALPPAFLERQLERRETAAEALAARDARALSAIIDEGAGEATMIEAKLARTLDAEPARDESRVLVRELTFLSKLVADLDEMRATLTD